MDLFCSVPSGTVDEMVTLYRSDKWSALILTEQVLSLNTVALGHVLNIGTCVKPESVPQSGRHLAGQR